jgi:sulfite exporter TauE/SafE
MANAFTFGEALFLGLASGPACVASCGPVLVPSLLAESAGLRLSVRYLSLFLAARLVGYLLFASMAWELGTLVVHRVPTNSMTFALVHILLGVTLLLYAYVAGRSCDHACAGQRLVTIGLHPKRGVPGAAILGFLTGVSFCPPFVAAGIRAAEATNIGSALLFFFIFFLGTSAWFFPFAGMCWVRRNEGVLTVARMAMVLIASYYLFAGLAILLGKNGYGY